HFCMERAAPFLTLEYPINSISNELSNGGHTDSQFFRRGNSWDLCQYEALQKLTDLLYPIGFSSPFPFSCCFCQTSGYTMLTSHVPTEIDVVREDEICKTT